MDTSSFVVANSENFFFHSFVVVNWIFVLPWWLTVDTSFFVVVNCENFFFHFFMVVNSGHFFFREG